MKSIILIIIIAFTAYSCKKFENDPFYSTYTVKSRLTKNNEEYDRNNTTKWVLTSYKTSEYVDVEIPENVFTLYFSKEGFVKIQNGASGEGSEYVNIITKNYKLSSNKDAIIIDSIGTYKIKKLTVVDLELTDSLSNKLTFKLKSTNNGFYESAVDSELLSLFNIINVTGNGTNTIKIGDFYQGGIVGYIFKSTDLGYVPNETHGIIIANNFGGIQSWDAYKYILTGATDAQIGYGKINTNTIVNTVGYLTATISYAAKSCYNYSINGYDDWFLPSINELMVLPKNITSGKSYQSSTELDKNNNYYLGSNGNTYTGSKGTYRNILAIRYF